MEIDEQLSDAARTVANIGELIAQDARLKAGRCACGCDWSLLRYVDWQRYTSKTTEVYMDLSSLVDAFFGLCDDEPKQVFYRQAHEAFEAARVGRDVRFLHFVKGEDNILAPGVVCTLSKVTNGVITFLECVTYHNAARALYVLHTGMRATRDSIQAFAWHLRLMNEDAVREGLILGGKDVVLQEIAHGRAHVYVAGCDDENAVALPPSPGPALGAFSPPIEAEKRANNVLHEEPAVSVSPKKKQRLLHNAVGAHTGLWRPTGALPPLPSSAPSRTPPLPCTDYSKFVPLRVGGGVPIHLHIDSLPVWANQAPPPSRATLPPLPRAAETKAAVAAAAAAAATQKRPPLPLLPPGVAVHPPPSMHLYRPRAHALLVEAATSLPGAQQRGDVCFACGAALPTAAAVRLEESRD